MLFSIYRITQEKHFPSLPLPPLPPPHPGLLSCTLCRISLVNYSRLSLRDIDCYKVAVIITLTVSWTQIIRSTSIKRLQSE